MRLSPSQYRAVTIGALLAVCAIVVTGVAVRLTGSGLGCDDWPNCNDSQLIDVSSRHAAIEQVNRLFTGLVSVAVIAAVLGSLVREPRRRDLTWWSVGLVAGVLGQIVLGGVTVLVDLHPVAVQGHLLLSMVLVANATVLVRRAGEPDGVERRDTVSPVTRAIAFAVAAGASLAVFTGTLVTGAGPHAGDEDVRRFGFHIPTVARIHGVTVTVTIAVALGLVWRVRRHRRRTGGDDAGDDDVVVRRRPPSDGRLRPVLQRRAGTARRAPRRRGDRSDGRDDPNRARHPSSGRPVRTLCVIPRPFSSRPTLDGRPLDRVE